MCLVTANTGPSRFNSTTKVKQVTAAGGDRLVVVSARADVVAKLDEIKAGIIDGSISVKLS